MIKDFLGREIEIGDSVVFCELRYRSLIRGVVRRITPKMLFIECPKSYGLSGTHEVKQFHDQVIKIEDKL